jgi:hypothetical protein
MVMEHFVDVDYIETNEHHILTQVPVVEKERFSSW